jgi:hypothetical protein
MKHKNKAFSMALDTWWYYHSKMFLRLSNFSRLPIGIFTFYEAYQEYRRKMNLD